MSECTEGRGKKEGEARRTRKDGKKDKKGRQEGQEGTARGTRKDGKKNKKEKKAERTSRRTRKGSKKGKRDKDKTMWRFSPAPRQAER